MLSTDITYLNMNKTLARTIKGQVELYDGSTLLGTYSPTDALQYIHVERAGESGKFFGFGVCQKLTVKLVDKSRTITPVKGNIVKIYFSVNSSSFMRRVCPEFTITNVERDEKTNILTITAYDKLHATTVLKVSDLPNLKAPYSAGDLAEAISEYLGFYAFMKGGSYTNSNWDNSYAKGANFSGDETLRTALNTIAEATQTIYFADFYPTYDKDILYFKALSKSETADLVIRNEDYFELTTQPAKTITGICHVTELGDNIVAGSGTIQYVKENAFWSIATDTATRLEKGLNAVNGITITPFNCTWRGNFVTQIGDKIAFEDKTGANVYSYILNDSFEYNGGFKQVTTWSYEEQEKETAAPTTLGEKINQTTAKVDKVNQQIILVASTVDSQNERIAELQVSTDGISGKVSSIEQVEQENIDAVNERIDTIAKETSMKLDADGVEIVVSRTLSEGVEKVVTSAKHYTFDDAGLNISSSQSNISTTITEDGMRIYRSNEEVLVADNEGVKAEDLHATTFLIIGETSRLEDRGNRTACFWIGD